MGEKIDPPNLLIPKKSVDELIPFSNSPIVHPVAEDGNISTLELLILNNLVRTCTPKNIFEIGNFNGRTTLNFALNSPAEAKIYTLDLPAEQEGNTAFSLEENEKTYVLKPESGILFKTSNHPEK